MRRCARLCNRLVASLIPLPLRGVWLAPLIDRDGPPGNFDRQHSEPDGQSKRWIPTEIRTPLVLYR